MQRKTISVTGMSCNGCEQTVGNALKTIDGVTRVDADHGATPSKSSSKRP